MDKYKTFLADNVITEDKVITFRLLARSLGVHVNTAKQMLYDFHKSQNDRRPGAIHATYLVYGSKEGVSHSSYGTDGDIKMASSPPDVDFVSDSAPSFSLALIPEERLKDELAQYNEVVSIHVYSIEPGPMKDMALLLDAVEEVFKIDEEEDFKKPNVVVNPQLRRRERTHPAIKSASATTSKPVKQEVKPAFAAASLKAKEAPKSAEPAAPVAKASAAPTTKKAVPALKRGGSSNSGIMQAFSKAATKVKKEASANNSRAATPSGDDSSMHPLSDDGEDDDVPQPKPLETAGGRKSKKEREDELRRMMEEDDDEEEDQKEKSPTPEEEPIEEPTAPEPQKEEPSEVVTTSANGRRRGKRRIMRKKQIMDEQGYLVTIQEPGWESFSEDEAPPAVKPKISAAPAAPAAKGKKAAPKGQGNIMSFFSKK
ncbi:DNA polymerase subunit Cdc27 [Cercophora newfieldiana]|uniref:DNA polymerase delta subunit 3 n=1 Tax=Cercophora newfieldiana TaxID=92897 RepID=A0AA39Y5T2_9PEZI|nr:DNA polymerase subunit Cdc27 [Cercophora newfieldiana]